MNNKRETWIFDFFICKISNIGLLSSKIIIFIIEISLKLRLQTKYGWNEHNSRRLRLKSPKFNFLSFLAAEKFIPHTNIQIHVKGSIFILIWFFLNARNNVSIRTNNNRKVQTLLITESTIPLITRKRVRILTSASLNYFLHHELMMEPKKMSLKKFTYNNNYHIFDWKLTRGTVSLNI